jgi:hypothetical protein
MIYLSFNRKIDRIGGYIRHNLTLMNQRIRTIPVSPESKLIPVFKAEAIGNPSQVIQTPAIVLILPIVLDK